MLLRIANILVMLIIIDDIVAQVQFPERFETDKKKSNLAGRLPLYAPTRCKHDELLYPGDQLNDWICDCAPAALYHPDSDACFPAFRQGPCPTGQFLILLYNKIIPQCVPNSCRVDGQISIQNKCYTLGEGPPCQHTELSYALGVDPNTLFVECVRQSIAVATRFGDFESDTNATNYDWEKLKPCLPGSKRLQNGTCHIEQNV